MSRRNRVLSSSRVCVSSQLEQMLNFVRCFCRLYCTATVHFCAVQYNYHVSTESCAQQLASLRVIAAGADAELCPLFLPLVLHRHCSFLCCSVQLSCLDGIVCSAAREFACHRSWSRC